MSKKQDWAIIGGGMLGMTLALRLIQQGQKVTIYESAEKAGGWQVSDSDGFQAMKINYFHREHRAHRENHPVLSVSSVAGVF